MSQFNRRGCKIGIIGLGYVGLPLGLQFARKGVEVIGLDVDQKKVDALNAGTSYIEHIPSAAVAEQVTAGSVPVLRVTPLAHTMMGIFFSKDPIMLFATGPIVWAGVTSKTMSTSCKLLTRSKWAVSWSGSLMPERYLVFVC